MEQALPETWRTWLDQATGEIPESEPELVGFDQLAASVRAAYEQGLEGLGGGVE